MKTALAFMAAAVAAEAFVTPSSFAGSALTAGRVSRASSMTMEAQGAMYETMDSMEKEVAPAGGGFWFGSAGFWGEEDYRGFVDSYKPDNLINGVYPIVDRVRDTKILTTTAESGLISELADAGLSLSVAEKLLPALEDAGLLSFAANNGDVLINLFGFLAVEPAKIALPAVVSVVKALKGAGLLNLADLGSDVPAAATAAVAASPVKASRPQSGRPQAVRVKAPTKAPKAVAAKKVAVKAAPKVSAVKAAPKAKAAPKRAAVKVSAVKVAPVAKAAPKPVAVKAAPVKKATPVKKAPAKKTAPSPSKGNIANLPKAL